MDPPTASPGKKPRKENWKQLQSTFSSASLSADWKQLEVHASSQDDDSWQQVSASSWKRLSASEAATSASNVHASRVTKHEISFDEATLSFLVPEGADVHDHFGRQAIDMQQIRSFTEGAKCGCTWNCLTLFTNDQILRIRKLWHSLGPDGQTQYVRCQWLSSQVGPERPPVNEEQFAHRTCWKLYGQQVCFHGISQLLASSRKTLLKRIAAEPDRRRDIDQKGKLPTRVPVQRNMVDFFFAELYHSTAERLPEQYHVSQLDEDPQMEMVMGDADLETFTWSPEGCLLDAFTAPTFCLNSPKRKLPPGSPMLLYWQFRAWHAAVSNLDNSARQACPSWATFYRAFTDRWHSVLGFRKASQHKDCEQCFEWREKLASKTIDRVTKMTFAKAWQEHLRAQYADKLLYWGCRLASRQRSGMLCLILDSMDRGKTCFPKYRFNSAKLPPQLQQLHRPQMILTAVIAHGWATCFFLANQYLHHGASASCEVIARTLDVCYKLAQERGEELPRHIFVQADNTTAQTKNSLNSLFAAYLTGTGRASSFTIAYMVPGHTKEDIDRLFSCVLSKVIRPHSWQTPTEFASLLQTQMEPMIQRRGEKIHVQQLHHIHDFNDWLTVGTGCKLSGTFAPSRDGRAPAHSFTFKVRADLTAADQARVAGDDGPSDKSPDDVFCLVKGRMHHTQAQAHPPVLVLPHRLLQKLPSRAPSTLVAHHSISPEESVNYRKLMARLLELPNPLVDAANCIGEMLDEGPLPPPLPWQFLQADPPPPQRITHTRNEYYENLPDVSKKLIASFRRR